jgi:hypothetical protein
MMTKSNKIQSFYPKKFGPACLFGWRFPAGRAFCSKLLSKKAQKVFTSVPNAL